jgi:hypothetical protein
MAVALTPSPRLLSPAAPIRSTRCRPVVLLRGGTRAMCAAAANERGNADGVAAPAMRMADGIAIVP